MNKESSYNLVVLNTDRYDKVIESIGNDYVRVELIDKQYKESKNKYKGIKIETRRNIMCFTHKFMDDLLESLYHLRNQGYDLDIAIKAINDISAE